MTDITSVTIDSKEQLLSLNIGTIVNLSGNIGVYAGKKYSPGCSCGSPGSFDPLVIYNSQKGIEEESIDFLNRQDNAENKFPKIQIIGMSQKRKVLKKDEDYKKYALLLKQSNLI